MLLLLGVLMAGLATGVAVFEVLEACLPVTLALLGLEATLALGFPAWPWVFFLMVKLAPVLDP